MTYVSRILVGVLLSAFLDIPVHSQSFISQHDVQSVFLIQNRSIKKFGSSFFVIDSDTSNYLVTAKHLFPNNRNSDSVRFEIFKDTSWLTLRGKIYYHDSFFVDIAVIKINEKLKDFSPYKMKSFEYVLGDDGYFLGFPYGFKTSDKDKVNLGYPFPMIKKATFSGVELISGNISVLYFDGMNNPGFSGGPILMPDRFETKRLQIAGVISAYYPQNNETKTPFGTIKYSENSGIIIAFAAEQIYEVLAKARSKK